MSYEPNPYNQSTKCEKPTARTDQPKMGPKTWTLPRYTMPVSVALVEFGSYQWKEGASLAEVFMAGIAYAEKYHGIGPNENGDYL